MIGTFCCGQDPITPRIDVARGRDVLGRRPSRRQVHQPDTRRLAQCDVWLGRLRDRPDGTKGWEGTV